MPMLDLAAFRAAPLVTNPFPHLVLPRFIRPEAFGGLLADYPQLDKTGSFPVDSVAYGPQFNKLIEELNGPEMCEAFEKKFGLELADRPTVMTVRGRCCEKDGRIHTDTESKIITVLIYMNPRWEQGGGRLRLLRSATDLEQVLVEVPPEEGTLVAFRRTDNSYHGHKQFVGERRVIQFNWVTTQSSMRWHVFRHRLSAAAKQFNPFA
ncbi:MAG TPA: 2OG-Fe(II) oxygenase [Pirellulales bacterium]|nr:2OG-Fe(II) oxygenase [Pirellulales bacterium]